MAKTLHCLLLSLLLSSVVGPALAEDALPMDVVVIMDSSGSMKKTDPRELRKPAAKLFINLLDPEDRLSVMSFSDNAYPITFLSPLDEPKQKTRSLDATDKISSRGLYTNIHAALARGIDMLKDSHAQNRQAIIVFMSDGKMDVGDASQSEQLRVKIQQELTPLLKQYNIKVFSIAFTEESDQALLQEIADATDGRYALAASDDVLHRVFTRMFEQSKEPNMLPLFENQFVVDPSIREITIIANRSAETSQIYLETPSAERINAETAREGIKWFVSTGFDMITLSKPETGSWKILFSDDDNRAYIITDIKLRSEFDYQPDSAQAELIIKCWFTQNGERIANNELIASMNLSLELEHPDGQLEQISVMPAQQDGIFMARFTPGQAGIHSATVIAESKTFQRQQVFSFRAVLPEQQPEPSPEPAQIPAPAPEPAAADAAPNNEDPPEDDLGRALLMFLIINLVIAFIGINTYLIIKLRKNRNQAG